MDQELRLEFALLNIAEALLKALRHCSQFSSRLQISIVVATQLALDDYVTSEKRWTLTLDSHSILVGNDNWVDVKTPTLDRRWKDVEF